MLRIMRRYQKGVLGVLAILFICLAMAGFGIDMFMTPSERPAVSVNKKTVPYSDYYRAVRETRERYVQMFGAQFGELAKSFNLNIPQQVLDQQIHGLLFEEQAEALGLTVGGEELREYLMKSFDGDPSRYASFLRASGYSASQFEARLKQDLLRQQYAGLLDLASFASQKEAEALLTKQETAISLKYVQIDPANLVSTIADPEESVLKSYFESHVSDFQSEAQVSYEYLRLTPEKFKRDVVVTDEDIALYLSENEAKFSNPARAKVRHIQFLYPKDSTAEQQKTTKERAEAALKRAKAGESFESLVLELSDDITTKMIGGDIGWVDSSSADKDVAAKIFALRGSGIAELAETSSGFRVLKVDEYQAPTVKELSEVRGEIEEAIRAAEASGYLGSRSLELYEEFRSDKTSLADIGVRYEVPVAKSASLINAATDPSEEVKGLTAQILENAPDTLLRIERPDAIILVKVSEYQEVRVPPFDEIKSRVAKVIKEQQAQKRAEEIARDLIQKVSNGSDLSVVAQEQTLKVETKEKMLRSAPVAVPFASEDAKRDLFAELKQGAVVAKPLQAVGGGYLVVQVSAVVPPTAEDLKKKLGSFREQASSSVGNTLTTAFLNQLKSKSKIDFDPSILGG